MDIKSAAEQADLRKATAEAPASNPEFAELSDKEKMSSLGSRIAKITSHEPGNNENYRKFDGTFTTDDGAEVRLAVSAYYSYAREGEDLKAEQAFEVDAIWSVEGHYLGIEQIGEATMRDHPEIVANMFNRLEESVTAAEQLHAGTSD